MRKFSFIVSMTVFLSFTAPVFADQIQARNCEIYISNLAVEQGSHGIRNLRVGVQVGRLPEGEFIQRAGYYGYVNGTDLGNEDSCHLGRSSSHETPNLNVTDFQPGQNDGSRFGEYSITFPIKSGSVVDACPGFEYTTVATFFVETNKNTYWINPSNDPGQYFQFDVNGYDRLASMIGYFTTRATDRTDLNYYNPDQCRY